VDVTNSPATKTSRDLHIIGFQVGRETYGVPITSLHEIVRVPEITPVPDSPVHMEGVINLRGKIVSVIDLRKRLGQKDTVPSKRNRILVVEHKGRLCGLMVDSASEVLKVPAEDIQPSTAVFQESGQNYVTGLGKFRGRLIVLLDMARLLEFSSVQPGSTAGASENPQALLESQTPNLNRAASAAGRNS
jgi:purine-binding chemotaxis protein CheW